MYLSVIVVLSIVLAFVRPAYRLLVDPGLVIAAAALATLLPPLLAVLLCRRVLQRLDANPEDPAPGQQLFARGMLRIQTLLLTLHAALLLASDWLELCYDAPLLGGWIVLPSLLAIVPFLLAIVLIWIAVYPAERAVRQIALEIYLFRGHPVTPVLPLPRHLMFAFRHQVLFILAPMLLILTARDVIDLYADDIRRVSQVRFMPDLLMGAAAGAVALFAPLILRFVWITQRLPDGPLRDRLLTVAAKLRLRCSEILVWRSGGMLVNAAVMGVIAPLRYVLITDAMLEQMDDRKIEAVFGHEAGHIKRHHILFFLLFAFISGALATVASIQTRRLDGFSQQLVITSVGALLVLKWGVLFGYISRRFERQADVFGVRTLALAGVPCAAPCALHRDATPPLGYTRLRDPLCATAAEVFSGTLHEVAVLNGIPPEAPSWRHSSISSRSMFVHELARDPRAASRFEHSVLRIKLMILLVATASGLWAARELQLWEALKVWLW